MPKYPTLTPSIRTHRSGGRSFPIGSPSLADRAAGMPEAYAYSRHTREPVTFHEGPVNWRGDLGQHSDFPVVGGIDVDVTRGDPAETLKHEQLHHVFPMLMNQDKQHGYIEGGMSKDRRVRDLILKSLPSEADAGLFKRIVR